MNNRYHFIGIGGIGMSALVRVLLQRGAQVTGSDIATSYITDQLEKEGAQIFIGHDRNNIREPSTVVCSTDIPSRNPEVRFAEKKGFPIVHRAELLSQIMEGYSPLLVTGTHGKTTTSSLLAHVLTSIGLNPSYAIGGMVPSLGNNGHHGLGAYFVAKADESDGSFLKYRPFGAIITNIDNDHLSYWKDEETLIAGFKQFAGLVLSNEHFIWCGDDEKLSRLRLKGISYGFKDGNDLQVNNYQQMEWKNVFDCTYQRTSYSEIEVPLIGGHNVLNAAAVFGMGLSLGLEEKGLRSALSSFKGVNRRLEKKGEKNSIAIYDDYGHHPTEIFATLRAVKHAIKDKRLVVIFQPHRYSRTRDCIAEFGPAFDFADLVIITDIYAAGEAPIEGVSTELLLRKIKESCNSEIQYVGRKEAADFLVNVLQPGDTLVTMGAGDITHLGPEVLGKLPA